MRVVKEYEERKTQIVEVSERLFSTKGYANCTVADIVKAVEVAKGTFFYYFATKEAVLDEIIRRRSEEIEAACRQITMPQGYSMEYRFLATIMQVNTVVGSKEQSVDMLHKTENALMHQKSMVALIRVLTPILSEIVSENYDEEKYGFASENIMIILSSTIVLLDEGCFDWDNRQKERILKSIISSASKLLGLREEQLSKEWRELCTRQQNM